MSGSILFFSFAEDAGVKDRELGYQMAFVAEKFEKMRACTEFYCRQIAAKFSQTSRCALLTS